MKISISTTFYRRDFAVENIYRQVLNQTYKDWEWIVTDDFSEDRNAHAALLDICSKDPRVKYFDQTRKKEMYWNPQKGCSGSHVLQLDSDDFLYPRTLEIYNHFFLKHPEISGISCTSHTVNADGTWIEVQGGGHYDSAEHSKMPYVPMGKMFKNVFPEFDNGTLRWYQQDTNIVRHMETVGKWFHLPRVLYKYYYAETTISRAPGRTDADYAAIEQERLFIEGKFPHLDNPDQTTAFLYYHPVHKLARDFSLADFNIETGRRKLLYIRDGIKIYEKQLLKELFFDQDLYFDSSLALKFDEIILSLTPELLEYLPEIVNQLKVHNDGVSVKMRYDSRNGIGQGVLFKKIEEAFGSYGWCFSGYEYYISTAV